MKNKIRARLVELLGKYDAALDVFIGDFERNDFSEYSEKLKYKKFLESTINSYIRALSSWPKVENEDIAVPEIVKPLLEKSQTLASLIKFRMDERLKASKKTFSSTRPKSPFLHSESPSFIDIKS